MLKYSWVKLKKMNENKVAVVHLRAMCYWHRKRVYSNQEGPHGATAIITRDSAAGSKIDMHGCSHSLHFLLPLSSVAPYVNKDLDSKTWNSATYF